MSSTRPEIKMSESEKATGTILDKIVADKEIWLHERMAQQPLESFQASLTPSDRSFYEALSGKPTKFILECKKASPSKGLIRPDFDLPLIAGAYKHYAAAISVLTDEKYFQGDFAFLPQVRELVTQPVLCKDFVIDPYQIYLARHYQGDAVLLMLSVLDDNEYRLLAEVAHSLNMGVLTEVSNHEELERAIALNAKVIGINNRNLRDLSITLERTPELAALIPDDRIVISESGIYNNQQVRALSKHANGFLVGSSLMSQDDVGAACRKLILGDNKVCGLTREQDVVAAQQAGAIYGGLIFAEKSPRFVSDAQAAKLVKAAPLQFVGVFVNEAVKRIVALAENLNLSAVQLHGDEDAAYIDKLRRQLPESVAIWKAVGVNEQGESQQVESAPENADRLLFDTKVGQQSGGTGEVFDWSLVADKLGKAMLAGGLNPNNAALAADQGALGLDFNSGLESAPGEKDADKINQAFSALRNY